MIRVRKRPAVIGIFVLLLVVSGLAAFLVSQNRKKDDLSSEASFVSAVDTAKSAIKDGVNRGNVDQALYIATELVNTSKTAEARVAVEAIGDDLLSNDQLKNKYTIILDSYKLDSNKDGFTQTVQSYTAVVASRNDPTLSQATSFLTPAYIEAVFTPQPVLPESEEIP
jgi:hypothetical protein